MINVPISKKHGEITPADLLNNSYYVHATKAIKALKKVNLESYCPDYVSTAINALERFYKGFLYAADRYYKDYMLPCPKFLIRDHNILSLVEEIRVNFPEAIPSYTLKEWDETKTFLRKLRSEYSASRYETYPSYEEFSSLLEYVTDQSLILKDYLNKYNGFPVPSKEDNELPLDF